MTSDSPVSPPTDQLVAAAKSVLTCCRECRDERDVYDDPVPPAEFIIWGKLAPPEALGPKCYDHAVKHLGHDMPGRSDQYAVVDLRPLRAALASQQGEPDTPAAHDQQGEPLMTLDEFLDTQPFEDSAPPSPTPDQANCDHAATCGRCGLSLDTRHEGGRCWVELHGEAASNWVAGMRADGLLAPAAPEGGDCKTCQGRGWVWEGNASIGEGTPADCPECAEHAREHHARGGELDDLLARAYEALPLMRQIGNDGPAGLVEDLASALRSQRDEVRGLRVFIHELRSQHTSMGRELAEARGERDRFARELADALDPEELFAGTPVELAKWLHRLFGYDNNTTRLVVVRAAQEKETSTDEP